MEENKKSSINCSKSNNMITDAVLQNIYKFQERLLGIKTLEEADDPKDKIIVRGKNDYKVVIYIFDKEDILDMEDAKVFCSFASLTLAPPEECKKMSILAGLKKMGCNSGYFFFKREACDSLMYYGCLPSIMNIDRHTLIDAGIMGISAHEFRHEMQANKKNSHLLSIEEIKDYFDLEDVDTMIKLVSSEARKTAKNKNIPIDHIVIKREIDADIISRIAEVTFAKTGNQESIYPILEL